MMDKILKIKIILLLLLFPVILFAQENVVNGVVTDNESLPIPGVNVVVKGTTNGTITDINGKYQIKVNRTEEEILKFSFIGMISKEVSVGSLATIDVKLETESFGIEEVVAIGYGTVKKKDLTGSIETVTGDELKKAMNTDITESLNGRISGVLVTKSSNRPGATMSMEIRGKNSINFSNEPLYVIDGIPSYSGMKHMNASDIESIDVLKDASSCAIYGSRGANGVVIITTKGSKVRKGVNTIEYSGNIGVKVATRIPDMIGNMGNGDEYVQYREALWRKKYGNSSLSRPDFLTLAEKTRIKNGEYYDWIREVSSPGIVTNHNLNSSGGFENTTYAFGIGYTKDDGLVEPETFERFTANVRLEHKLSEKLKTGVTSYISKNKTNHGANEALMNAYLIPPIASPYDENFEQSFIVQPTSSKINPNIQAENNIRESSNFYSNFSGYVEYKPIDFITLKSMLAYQFDTGTYGEWVGVYTQQKSGVNPNEAYRGENRNNNLVWDNIVTVDKVFNENNRLNVIGLFSLQKDTHLGSGMRGEDLPYDSFWHAIQTAGEIRDVSSYYWESSLISYMVRANYTFREKYMLTLTGRYDGTSRLQKENQWGFMPSVALGWQIKEESWLKDADKISKLRLRLSYGKSGNNNLGHDQTWTKLSLSRYTFGGNNENGFGISNEKGNSELRWEMTSEYNLGLDFGFFNSRVSGTIDVYSRKTEDLILKRSISSVNGYTSVFQNIGTTSNKGFELGLNTINISSQNFVWKTNLTFSLNQNKIIDLYGDKMDDLGNRWFIGEPVRVTYDFKHLGIWQEEEVDEAAKYGQSMGHIKVEDVNGDYSLDEKDYQILGSPTPDWTAGMENRFEYRNLFLSIDMYARVGGIYNDQFAYMFTAWDNEHWNKLDVNYWTPENRSNEYQRVGAVSYYTQVLGKVSGTFLKVRNITFGYNIRESFLNRISLSDAQFYVAVQNPFTFTNYIGSDPEIIGENVSSQLSLYPMTFSTGVNIKF